jgi:Actinobacteria/chloroflexi VLRF1 release factor
MENGRGPSQRWLDLSPEHIEGWLESFAERHGATATAVDDHRAIATVRAADGSIAECHAPFPPLTVSADGTGADLAAHARADRTVAVLLVRLGGYAAGVFAGVPPQLVASKVGSRLVHGRSAAGGTSQHRFARRREKQVREALEAAADNAVSVFNGFAGALDAVVLGGDKRSMAVLREDSRLRPYFDIAVERFLTVRDPRLAVLQDTPRLFRAIRIRLTEVRDGEAEETGSPDGSALT